jgi:hypothetical protein
MSIRRRDDSVKPSDPTGGAVSRDIFDDVEGQSSDSGNRAVRSRGQP